MWSDYVVRGKQIAKVWLSSAKKIEYGSVVFRPCDDTQYDPNGAENDLNTWRGWVAGPFDPTFEVDQMDGPYTIQRRDLWIQRRCWCDLPTKRFSNISTNTLVILRGQWARSWSAAMCNTAGQWARS